MQHCLKNSFFYILFFISTLVVAQNQEKDDYIRILHANHASTSNKYPGKQLLSGNVEIEHNGAFLFCDKAIVDKNDNLAIAVGNVLLKQGDTITMRAGFLRYNGNESFAEAYENVELEDPKMKLQTDTIYFDRQLQIAYYTSGGIIQDSVNTLTSKIGKYFFNEKRFRFINNVHIKNPDYQIDSYQLDYFTETGISDFNGPTKIYNTDSYIYAEKGHYDSHREVSWFVKNSFIKHKHTSIKADSLFYDRKIEYATGNKNVIVFDSINNTWIFTDLAQRWINKDSIRVSQNPLVVTISDKDTVYIKARQFIMKGLNKNKILWAYTNVRFYSKDFSARADSLYRNESKRIMKLLQKPVLWSEKNQITGKSILLKNDSLNRIDSLIIPEKVFIIQEDDNGFNQIKGKKLLGKFKDKQLKTIDILGNAEVIYYLREEDATLMGIEKNKSSRIYIEFKEGEISLIRFYNKPEGIVYPYKDFPEKEKFFPGFEWRKSERITSKEQLIGDKKLNFNPQPKQKPVFQTEEVIDTKMFKKNSKRIKNIPDNLSQVRKNLNKNKSRPE